MKKMLLLSVILTALAAPAQITLSTQAGKGALPMVTANEVAMIVTDEADAEVVATAADCVAQDIKAVTGKALLTSHLSSLTSHHSPLIIAGTVGQSPVVDALIAKGKVDASQVSGKWEAYSLQMVEKPMKGVRRALVIIGSTPRGTAYGLFELSRLAGVSPWIWWADVAPEKKQALYLSGSQLTVGEPSVKYRGIFINDEDWGLQPWAAKGIDKQYDNIGPNTYARVMELLLRLRANTLWPAMHPCSEAFWANKDNLPVARKYDIMLGSSHCEQMLRDNEWEWRHEPWNGVNEDWNYVTNKAKIQRYWEERVAESVGIDAMYTLGMRGVHDWGISGYPTTEDKVRGLTEIIGFQRDLLSKYFGDATKVPQLFIPYKEVLDAYNAGLQVPEDVTLCWVDDNHGYIRQLPNRAEQARSGGNGIYYHISYWGRPEDYLWLCSHSPSLISYELSRAYDQGIRTLWVINVGDIKPAEMELEFCMDLAWDINRWSPEKAINYSREWAARTFGEQFADDIADIKREYYRLAAAGKPEHIHKISFSNDDKDRRMADYAAIARKVDELKGRIPAHLQDAFFQLIEYPVKGAYYMNVKTFCNAEARNAYNMIEQLTKAYNNEIAGGKWNGIMDFKPRKRPQFDMPTAGAGTSISGPTLGGIGSFVQSSSQVKTIAGLGIAEASVTVWPLDMTAYTDAAKAPYAEYTIPVSAGANRIELRCLPTFPINTSYDLRLAVSIDGAAPTVHSLKTVAQQGKWNTAVLQGYNDVAINYQSDKEKTVTLRISFLDPGLVLSEIRSMVKTAE